MTAACVAVAAAAAVSFLPRGLPSPEVGLSSGDPAPNPPHRGTTQVLSERDEPSLRLHVQMPSHLDQSGLTPVRIGVSSEAGGLDPDDLMEVRLEVATPDELRGRVWIQPSRLLVRGSGLHRAAIALGALPTVPCEEDLGELRVTLRTVSEGDLEGTASAALPERRCDQESPPEAPDTVHLDTPVCGDDWREHAEALIEGETPPPARCRPAPRRASDPSDDDADEDEASEEDEDSDDESDDDRAPNGDDSENDGDGDGNGGNGNRGNGNGGDGDGGDDGSEGNGNGGNGNGDDGNEGNGNGGNGGNGNGGDAGGGGDGGNGD